MREIEMDSSMDVRVTSVIPRSTATNWIVARGSLESSVAVESSDCPIPESDLEIPKSALLLKPAGSDSGPCEITIHFEHKFEIGQIYVRSTARVYEIYYARSSHGSNEYLCTVRCGAAERDGKILQTTSSGDVDAHRDCSSDELNEETVAKGGITSNGEDDWVKIKAPEVGTISSSDKVNSDRAETIQDLYEATAQINDAEPCSSLTIRLLSLQDKGNVCVDEIYVFLDPVASSDSGNESVLEGNSTQSSLMAMLPALLQISKSGASRIQDKRGSDEVLKADSTETVSEKNDQIDFELHEKQVQPLYKESEKLDKDTSDSAEPLPSPTTNKCTEPVNTYTVPARNIENTLEQLVSRVSRVEDIFLRFEEKLLQPIERIEARLQQVEVQLEKLAQSSCDSALPRGIRISAPAFSGSESNSSSLYKDQSDYPTCGPSEIENDPSCLSIPELPQSEDTKVQPSNVVSAPEFTDGEDEGTNDDVKLMEDFPSIKPKKALSVDDALAEAFHGFLASSLIPRSVDIQTTSDHFIEVDYKGQHQELVELHQTKGPEFLAAERESMHYTKVLTVKAPDFNADEIGNADELKYSENVEKGHNDEIASKAPDFNADEIGNEDELGYSENVEKGHNDEIASTDSDNFLKSENSHDFELATNGENSSVSSDVNTKAISSDGNDNCMPTTVTNNEAATDLVENFVISDDTNPKQLDSEDASEVPKMYVERNKDVIIVPPTTESPSSSLLDFNFPILQVKFTSDNSSIPTAPLEALLHGSGYCFEDNNLSGDNHFSEMTDFLPGRPLLVDIGISDKEGPPDVPSSPAIGVSLI